MTVRVLLAAALSAWALWGEPDRSVGRTALVALAWTALGGLPSMAAPRSLERSRAATSRGAALVWVAVALPALALAVRIDLALGAAAGDALRIAGFGLLLLAGLAAGASRAADSAGWAWVWLGAVVALPLAVAAFAWSALPGAELPEAVTSAARASPLAWAWSAARAGPAAAPPSAWPAVATVALLLALSAPRARGRGERPA